MGPSMEAADLHVGELSYVMLGLSTVSADLSCTCTCRDFPYISVMTLVRVCCPNKDREISPVLYHFTHIVLNMLYNYTCDSISYVQFRRHTP